MLPAVSAAAVDYEIRNPEKPDTSSRLESRFKSPSNFIRVSYPENSFGGYLRNLPLKPPGTDVHLYNGVVKHNSDAHAAVVDLPIGEKDLHQCADAVMRLRAEYLWQQELFDEIHFNFTNGFRADYSRWRAGERISVKGNDVKWTTGGNASSSYESFWAYLEKVFTYAGTASLSRELRSIPLDSLQTGDVFIIGGAPGHAVIVVDVAIHSETGEKAFLLAQSYMPAQEIHILKNPGDEHSPWYRTSEIRYDLVTPEWRFTRDDLKRFPTR